MGQNVFVQIFLLEKDSVGVYEFKKIKLSIFWLVENFYFKKNKNKNSISQTPKSQKKLHKLRHFFIQILRLFHTYSNGFLS